MLNAFFNHDGETLMSELRVLGIGSPFGDDQLGWNVVQLLQQCPELTQFIPDRLQLICCDRPGMYLLELMRDANTVFLIDAVKTGAAVGTLHRFENQEIETISNRLSSHALGVADAIKMGRVLHELPPKVIMYGLEIDDIQNQFSLSEKVMRAIRTLSTQIKNDILKWLHTTG